MSQKGQTPFLQSRFELPRLAVILFVAVVICVWALGRGKRGQETKPATETLTSVANERPDRPRVVVQNQIAGTVPRSPLADKLNAPGATVQEDVRAVKAILLNYITTLRQAPTGTNREITAQLAGKNQAKHAPLPPDAPAISGVGELVDRWGHPYAFHNLGRYAVEVRSRGPDGILFTADDVVETTGVGPDFLNKK